MIKSISNKIREIKELKMQIDVLETELSIMRANCDHVVSKIHLDNTFFYFICDKCGKRIAVEHRLSSESLEDSNKVKKRWNEFNAKALLI